MPWRPDAQTTTATTTEAPRNHTRPAQISLQLTAAKNTQRQRPDGATLAAADVAEARAAEVFLFRSSSGRPIRGVHTGARDVNGLGKTRHR